MKTKMKLHLIIYITIVSFLTACENEIPYNPGQQDPQIIMNALLETGQAENDVYLHLGEGYSIEHLNEATLSLYINGKIAETPKAVSPEEIYGHLEGELDKDVYESLLKSIRFKKYRLTSTLHPGDNIRLEATAENGKYHASAEVHRATTDREPARGYLPGLPARVQRENPLPPIQNYIARPPQREELLPAGHLE